jgi:hypothetical protein
MPTPFTPALCDRSPSLPRQGGSGSHGAVSSLRLAPGVGQGQEGGRTVVGEWYYH